MITFNADEIFEMAEQIERNGAKFYRKAAEPADGGCRKLLLRLAAMEDDHEKTFAEMRRNLSDAEKRPITADPDNEGALYLQAMADGKVFEADPAGQLSGQEPIEDILQTAIGLEKDSVVFYNGMKDVVAAGKEKIDAIIKQELGHILDLTKQLKAAKK
ncbi:MAG: ferritin family protein [Planctomycetota bacterium]|nr:ferritin family protein [Planctomycetota bacterium]